MKFYDCIVVGGGAAGLMCAATAGKRGLSVAVLDHANKVGKKILMSGGGRCNFTNYFVEPNHFLSSNSHFCKSALSRYTQYDFIALVDKYELAYHEKKQGQLFCDHKAKDILAILLQECETAGVDIVTKTSIHTINKCPEQKDSSSSKARYYLDTSIGKIGCYSLVVATGGLSIPTMGASGYGHDIAKQFGIKIKPRYASLVPFTLHDTLLDICCELSGLSVEASVMSNDHTFNESMLFTHKGLSGPAILQISNYWMPSDEVTINFLPNTQIVEAMLTIRKSTPKITVTTVLNTFLAKRFVNAWLSFMAKKTRTPNLATKRIADLSRDEMARLALFFNRFTFVPNGTEGYRTAEVTKGGVDTDAISSKTFEAKNHNGLYFIGEVLDVTGWLGGFNFQWAWSSGYCAGQSV